MGGTGWHPSLPSRRSDEISRILAKDDIQNLREPLLPLGFSAKILAANHSKCFMKAGMPTGGLHTWATKPPKDTKTS